MATSSREQWSIAEKEGSAVKTNGSPARSTSSSLWNWQHLGDLARTALMIYMGVVAFRRKDLFSMPTVLLVLALTRPSVFRWIFGIEELSGEDTGPKIHSSDNSL